MSQISLGLLIASAVISIAGAVASALLTERPRSRALIPVGFWALLVLSTWLVGNIWLFLVMVLASSALGILYGWLARMNPDEDPVDKAMAVFGDVHEGESPRVLLLTSSVFTILCAYYILKTVREPLILASGGAEMKSYAAAAQALVLVGFVPAYSWLASQVSRIRLIVVVTVVFIVCIELFYLGALIEVPNLGFIFYVWVGIFSVSIIAQFWSYANDLYQKGAGERLFPVIAVGMTAGPPVGSYLAKVLFDQGVEAYTMFHITAVLLVVQLGLLIAVEVRARKGLDSKAGDDAEGENEDEEKPIDAANGFMLVLRNKYIRLIAILLILLNLVNTTGEYILGKLVLEAAQEAALTDEAVKQFIGSFYGEFFSVVNVVVVLLQAFVVSRIVKYTGMWGVLFALPVVALGAYSIIALGAGLSVVRWVKTAENSTDYSVMNTAKAMLWLPTTREEKYAAKQTVDTFFVRVGDMLSAGVVWVGSTWLALSYSGFAAFNVILVLVWMGIAWLLVREYKKLGGDVVPDDVPV